MEVGLKPKENPQMFNVTLGLLEEHWENPSSEISQSGNASKHISAYTSGITKFHVLGNILIIVAVYATRIHIADNHLHVSSPW